MPRGRTLLAWLFSISLHLCLLITLGSMMIDGGKPTPPADDSITLRLTQAPAPQPVEAAPEPKPVTEPPAPKPKPKPKPKPRPEPKPRPKPEPQPEPEPEEVAAEAEPPTAPATPQPQTQPASQPDQPQPAGHQGQKPATPLERYLAKVRSTIDHHKHYPHRARLSRQEGTVTVAFQISSRGRAKELDIIASSGSRLLDRATLRLIARLRFDPPPAAIEDIPINVEVPVSYRLSNS